MAVDIAIHLARAAEDDGHLSSPGILQGIEAHGHVFKCPARRLHQFEDLGVSGQVDHDVEGALGQILNGRG